MKFTLGFIVVLLCAAGLMASSMYIDDLIFKLLGYVASGGSVMYILVKHFGATWR